MTEHVTGGSLYRKEPKIYPRQVSGRFARLRVVAVWVLLGLFYLLPWLQIGDKQAVLFDLPARKFYLFGLTFWPQDFVYLALLLITAGLSLFFFTALAGRLWCGFACPQTVWTEVFIWLERLIEGDRQKRMKLDAAPWDAQKILRKSAKQAVWILFAAWTGEEVGLLGSGHFVDALARSLGNPARLSPRVAAYLNLDMVGRLDKQLYLQGVGSSPVWKGEIERRNVPIGLSVVTRDDSYLPTDATSFYLKGVPILSAFTGVHGEYNTPRDAPDTLNYEGLARVARLMEGLTLAVARRDDAPEYAELPRPAAGTSRRNLRAYLGTVPEYGDTASRGVKLSGVAKGAPAETAGLRPGDVLVELAGRRLENVYDFTHALNALKVGQAVEIVVERGAQHLHFQVTPAARE